MEQIKTLKVGDYTIYCKDRLCGVRHWAQWFSQRVPAYEIFHYLGSDKNEKIHFFQSRKSGMIIWKRYENLLLQGFKPFLLDLEKIDQFYQNI